MDIPTSETLGRIASIVISNMVWAAAVVLFHMHIYVIPTVTSTGPGLLKSALGYLLVFRTNAAYHRFWEGRKIWQNVVDSARKLTRYVLLFREELGNERAIHALQLVRAFCLSLKHHLAGSDKEEEDFLEEYLLTPEEVERLEKSRLSKPMFIVQLLEEVVMSANIKGIFRGEDRLRLINLARELGSAVAACERIVQTPIPLNYVRHTSRLITLWCLTLPVALVGEMEWLVVPVTAFVTWAFFSIQEIGLSIEEPFSSYLKLDVFCRTIFQDTEGAFAALGPPELDISSRPSALATTA